jgi:opacity protein-like surface antigen
MDMLKKGMAVALIAAASSAYAGGPEVPAPVIYVGGAYVDVGLSHDDLQNYWIRSGSRSVTNTFDGNTINYRVPEPVYKIDSGAKGWDGFLGFGYHYVWNREWSLGFEIFGDLTSLNGTQFVRKIDNRITGDKTVIYQSRMRVNETVGVSIFPGYYVAPGSLYFLDIGYVNTEFKINGFPARSAANIGEPSGYEYESGSRLGFGVNTQVGRHFAVRQEYLWENYENPTFTNYLNTRSSDDLIGVVTLNANRRVKTSPEIEKYNVAAVYYFTKQGNATDLNTAPARVGGQAYFGINMGRDEALMNSGYWDSHTLIFANNALQSDLVGGEGGLAKIYGWNLGLVAGYGFNFSNRWYAGLELTGNFDESTGQYRVARGAYNTNTRSFGAFSMSAKFEKEGDFGVAFMPGYQVSDQALLYARVGYVGAQFRVINAWSGETDLTPAQNALLTFKHSKWVDGLQLGVGVDTMVYQNLSLRTEFDINNYGNFNVREIPISTTSFLNSTISTSAIINRKNIIEDSFNVSLIWHFFR